MKPLLPFAFLAITVPPAGACSGTQQAIGNDPPVAVTSGIAYTNALYYGNIEMYPEQYSGMEEIRLSWLGIEKAFKKLAASKNVDLPGLAISGYKFNAPDSTDSITDEDPGTNQKMNQPMTSPAKQFDPQYVNMMATAHQKTIILFKQGARSNDEELKAFAVKHLPMLKKQQRMILALKK